MAEVARARALVEAFEWDELSRDRSAILAFLDAHLDAPCGAACPGT